MLQFIFIISVIAYFIVGFFCYCEYKRKFMFTPKWRFEKPIYLFVHGILYLAIGAFIAVLGYLIFTM